VIVDMVTNYPQRLTATTTGIDARATASVVARAITRVGQFMCGLRGHDAVLHFEGKRVMMRCTSCWHDSPGWEVSGRAPRQRFEGDSRRHMLAPRRLVLRKTA
jgi:predicted oxidoreductase